MIRVPGISRRENERDWYSRLGTFVCPSGRENAARPDPQIKNQNWYRRLILAVAVERFEESEQAMALPIGSGGEVERVSGSSCAAGISES